MPQQNTMQLINPTATLTAVSTLDAVIAKNPNGQLIVYTHAQLETMQATLTAIQTQLTAAIALVPSSQ